MNIGCLCEGFVFSQIIGAHIPGPTDGLHGWDFKSTLDIFNGKLFDAMLNDKIDYKEVNELARTDLYDDDEYFRYYCSKEDGKWNWRSVHSNFEEQHRKDTLKERINNFNNFNKNLNEDSYYFYTISDGDQYLNEDTFNYVINNLPEYVIDKLVIISGLRFEIPKLFYSKFRCIYYNFDLVNQGIEDREFIDKWKKIKDVQVDRKHSNK